EESSVESDGSIGLGDLDEAVNKSLEFSGLALSDVSSETGTGEVKGVDEAERGGSSSSSGSKVKSEELPELPLLVDPVGEQLLEGVLEGEVQGLGGEVSDNVGEISSPESGESLLLGHTDEHIDDTLVTLVGSNRAGDVLHLKEQLDALDGGDGSLGDGGGRTSGGQVEEELAGVEGL
ncbi:hypothetical protein PFISCL1PPCAC_17732, partial [Pristionchus fissidentatus]